MTTGPGGTNAITGLAGAWLDSTPVLFISGQVKRPDRMFAADGTPLGMRQLGVQEVDIVSIVKPLTKYAVTVLDPAGIRYHLEKAVHLALHGRPGPVWIDIPLDVQAAPIDETNLPAFEPREAQRHSTIPAWPNRCAKPSKLSTGPNAPCSSSATASAWRVPKTICAGSSRCSRFRWRPPGARPTSSPPKIRCLSAVPVRWPARGANFALQNCDFLLSIGARLDFAITGYAPEKLARAAHRVMVDIDAAEIAKLAPYIHTPICADAGAFLREMLRQAGAVQPKDRNCWNQRCADWKTRYPVVLDEHRKPEGLRQHLQPGRDHRAGDHARGPDDLAVTPAAASRSSCSLAPRAPDSASSTPPDSAPWVAACPDSIGVCIAGGRQANHLRGRRWRLSVQHSGTGHGRRLNLPIKYFILNNDGYASIRASQSNFFGSAVVGCDERTGVLIPDLCKVATAFGLDRHANYQPGKPPRAGAQRLEYARPGCVRRAGDPRRSPRAAPFLDAARRWLAGFQAPGRSLALPPARGVLRQYDRSAPGGLA